MTPRVDFTGQEFFRDPAAAVKTVSYGHGTPPPETIVKLGNFHTLNSLFDFVSAMSKIVSKTVREHRTPCRRLHKLRRDEDQIELSPNAFCVDVCTGRHPMSALTPKVDIADRDRESPLCATSRHGSRCSI
jgi:hypothetical protein